MHVRPKSSCNRGIPAATQTTGRFPRLSETIRWLYGIFSGCNTQFRYVPAGKKNRFPVAGLLWNIQSVRPIFPEEKAHTKLCPLPDNLIFAAPEPSAKTG